MIKRDGKLIVQKKISKDKLVEEAKDLFGHDPSFVQKEGVFKDFDKFSVSEVRKKDAKELKEDSSDFYTAIVAHGMHIKIDKGNLSKEDKNLLEFLTMEEIKYIYNLIKDRDDFDTLYEAIATSENIDKKLKNKIIFNMDVVTKKRGII